MLTMVPDWSLKTRGGLNWPPPFSPIRENVHSPFPICAAKDASTESVAPLSNRIIPTARSSTV